MLAVIFADINPNQMKKYFFLLTLAFLNFTNVVAQSNKVARLDSLYTALYNSGIFNGNVLIAESGKTIFQKSYGLANEKTKVKLDSKTAFELASVSKQFTAMAIVFLNNQGKLSYSDDIAKHLPELSAYKGITIQNLLVHTGGLPDYMQFAGKHLDMAKIATNQDILNIMKEFTPKPVFEPGEKWQYSNTGYLILGSLIEKVSGKSFGVFLKENIFKPLKMDRTFVYRRRFNPEKIKKYADGYIYSDSLKRKILPDELGKDYYVVVLDGIVGDGMVNSTTEDLLKWDRALYANKFISDTDRQMIFSSYKTNAGKETDYGFGWNIKNSKEFGKTASHSGGWGGYITYIERDLDHDKTIIILQNNDTEKTKIPAKDTRQILYNLPIEKQITVSEDILKKYAGIYVTSDGKESTLIFEEGKLFIPFNPEVKLELIPVSATKFIVDGFSPEVTYTFILNEHGEVAKYRVQQIEQGVDKESVRKKSE